MDKYTLQEQAKDALKEAIEWVVDASGELPTIDDVDLFELADGLVPVYTSDLIDLLHSDYGAFGWVDPEMGEVDTIDRIISWNCLTFLEGYMTEVFDEVLADVEIPQSPIDLLKTSDPRIVTGGKLTQYCPAELIDDFYQEYIDETGDDLTLDDWLDCFEEAGLDELDTATADQIFGLEQDDNGNWEVI